MPIENQIVPQLIYSPEPENERKKLLLTPDQKNAVRNITLGIEEVDEMVREMAIEDVIKTLENGHPLNRIIEDRNQNSVGYIACEDFVPHEAYIKYFGTNNQTGFNLLKEIPAFFNYAKQHGYNKINFHGWNKRLNHVLEHFGFNRVRTDSMGEFSVDFYEKALVESKTPEQISIERSNAFRQKYINKINKEYEKTLTKFPKEKRAAKEQLVSQTFNSLSNRLSNSQFDNDDFKFDDLAKAVLHLKLARHFQTNDTLDENVLFDALIETPKFLGSDKGSFFRLMEIHQEKTIQKIAEIRKKRAEISGNEVFNPYEALFETKSGKYYMARLLNMPHLKQESDYMNHCVGTSNSYINRIKNGEVEILSFRQSPQVNLVTKELKGKDRPIITIEYNLKTNTIEQLKKKDDEYLMPDDPYFNEVVEALKQLRRTKTDLGKPRNFKKIADSELGNIKVADYRVLTDRGEIPFRDFNPDEETFVLKIGSMPITSEMNKNDIAKIVQIIEGIKVDGKEIAQNQEEISGQTKMYIGTLSTDIFQEYPNLEYIYNTTFPEGKIPMGELKIDFQTAERLTKALEDNKININDYIQDMLAKMFQDKDYQERNIKRQNNSETIKTVILKVSDLGFTSNATTAEIIGTKDDLDEDGNSAPFTKGVMTKFGLELCPAEVGIYQRLKDTEQSMNDLYNIAMEPITDRHGDPVVFALYRSDDGLWLNSRNANPTNEWNVGNRFLFRLRNVSQET